MAFCLTGAFMNKFFTAIAVFAMVGMSLNAQSWTEHFRLSAWGKGVISPYAFSGEDSSVSAATTTSGNYPQVGFTVAGTAPGETIGFLVNAQWDGGVPGIGDNAKIWVKPFSFLKLTAGWFVEDDLRGAIGTTEFASWLLPNSGKDEDAFFTRFQAALGAHFKLEPLFWLDSAWNGLLIEGAFGSNIAPNGAGTDDGRAPRNIAGLSAEDVYKGMQIGLGYKIPEIGFVRFQFIGNKRNQLVPDYTNRGFANGQLVWDGLSKNSDADVIEGAVSFTRVSGLHAEAGVKIPLAYTTDVAFVEYPALHPNPAVVTVDTDERTVQRPASLALGANWTPSFFSNFNIIARFDFSFGGQIEEAGHHLLKFGNDMGIWLLASYRITERLKAGIDVGMEIKEKDEWQQPIGRPRQERTAGSDYTDFGIGPWVELNLGGGRIRTGPMIIFPGSERYIWISGNSTGYEFRPAFTGEPVVSFPIAFTYNF
jgi:hypothetical protein